MTQSRRQWLTGTGLALAIVVLAAAAFRLWHIGSIPPGLFGDEATDGLDALDVLAGKGAVFFPANFGREGLHIWIVAGFFKLLGVSALAVRLPSVIAGILTAIATLWLGVELTRSGLSWLAPAAVEIEPDAAKLLSRARGSGRGSKNGAGPKGEGPNRAGIKLSFATLALGLIAALYLSTSYFHVHFSRFGIRGVFTPLCGALAFAAFWRGVNTQAPRRNTYLWFAASGVFLGLGLHFYTASRFLPVFLAGFLILQAIVSLARRCPREAILVRNFGPVVTLFAVSALVFAPLGLYFVQHPGSFMQRASEVSAFKDGGGAWGRMGQAALANVLQFFVPGAGDTEQFYNLPGRPVFDPLTALLAVAGVLVLLWRWKQPAALFLLTWWPALLVPSFLATDRFPTLPRVLGTLPGVYFFPAAALLAAAGLWQRRRIGQDADASGRPQLVQGRRSLRSKNVLLLAPVVVTGAVLLVHAGFTYSDYFSTWGRAAATYDAFEADMTQAVDLLTPRPAMHVYLASDIYRHPTFMLLGQKVAVSRYFDAGDPNLSWFDARTAAPIPPEGQSAVYVLPSNVQPGPAISAYLDDAAARRAGRLPPGAPEMAVAYDLPAGARLLQPDRQPEAFTDRLSLIGAAWGGPTTASALRLYWQTSGPDPAGWRGYRLQIEGPAGGDGASWQVETQFDDFRPPEWTPCGRFLIWRELQTPEGAKPAPPQLRLRLIDVASGRPLLAPGSDGDGWHTVVVNRQ